MTPTTEPHDLANQPVTALLLDVMDTLVYDPVHEAIPGFFDTDLATLFSQKRPGDWVEFERGRMSERDFLERFFTDGRAYDIEGFVACIKAAYRWMDGVEPLLQALQPARAAGRIQIHALSNYPSWYLWIEERLALSRYLDWSFVSYNTGVRKPHPEAYLGAARTLGLPPAACLFVDDRRRNCEAARGVGMRAHRFQGAEGLRDALVGLGVLAG